MESIIGSTCLGDALGYLLIETVGRGETATKTGEEINIAKGLAVDLYLIIAIFLVLIVSPKSIR